MYVVNREMTWKVTQGVLMSLQNNTVPTRFHTGNSTQEISTRTVTETTTAPYDEIRRDVDRTAVIFIAVAFLILGLFVFFTCLIGPGRRWVNEGGGWQTFQSRRHLYEKHVEETSSTSNPNKRTNHRREINRPSVSSEDGFTSINDSVL